MTDIICVTNRHLCEGDFFERIEKIAACGVKAMILREKDLSESDYYSLAKRFSEICAKHKVEAILHTYADVAIKLRISSIHFPMNILQELDSIKKNNFSKIGVSCHSAHDILLASDSGAAYATFGHVFATDCKKGVAPRGLEALEEVCRRTKIPVYAIGGIDSGNISSVRNAGASGVCIMSGFMKCEEPKNFIHQLINFNGGNDVEN